MAILKRLNLRLDADDRIALLGANGEGKSTLSKLFANRLTPMSGEMRTANKLRVGFFAQHQLDELVPGETPFQHLQRLRPKELPTKIRARLGAAGIGADIVENTVERLSGGQKARLLMAMAAIDSPHILILDEPTNHLDIESREALVLALNDYSGAIILVSHDSHLVEMVADRLWIVRDGAVEVFDGDMNDYKRLLLSHRGAASKADRLEQKAASEGVSQRGSQRALSGKERRRNSSHIRAAITKAEKMMASLEAEKSRFEAEMASPGFYDAANSNRAKKIGQRMNEITGELVTAEEHWIEAQSELEALDS